MRWGLVFAIGSRGVIAYVTNGGFLTSNSADGMRKSLYDQHSQHFDLDPSLDPEQIPEYM